VLRVVVELSPQVAEEVVPRALAVEGLVQGQVPEGINF
jgi:hypothetical protein